MTIRYSLFVWDDYILGPNHLAHAHPGMARGFRAHRHARTHTRHTCVHAMMYMGTPGAQHTDKLAVYQGQARAESGKLTWQRGQHHVDYCMRRVRVWSDAMPTAGADGRNALVSRTPGSHDVKQVGGGCTESPSTPPRRNMFGVLHATRARCALKQVHRVARCPPNTHLKFLYK